MTIPIFGTRKDLGEYELLNRPMTFQAPMRQSYDVIIVGGAMYGAAIAWFLASNPDFDGTILVV